MAVPAHLVAELGYIDLQRVDRERRKVEAAPAQHALEVVLRRLAHDFQLDGALTKREKALIALAISHAEKCPYCIDAYTTQCLETGANPEQMMEAVHVAAVMQAGITLVHSVQMQNHLGKLVL